MNRKRISEALDGIEMEYIAECAAYSPKKRKLPSEKEHEMGRFKQVTKPAGRKLMVLVLAACLILALGLTAYAAGFLFLSNWIRGFDVEPPTDELWESRPEVAEWRTEQMENQAVLDAMAEKAVQSGEEKHPEGLADSGITLLESCYDGEKLLMACRFDAPQRPVTFDFDENHPLFAELHTSQEDYWNENEAWKWYVPLESDQKEIEKRLAENGRVGFTTYDFFISDHVLINGEDPGLSHSDPADNDGVFFVDPFYTSVFGSELPESVKNLPEVEITFTIRCAETHYWMEGDTIQWTIGEVPDYPVSFVLPNVNR